VNHIYLLHMLEYYLSGTSGIQDHVP